MNMLACYNRFMKIVISTLSLLAGGIITGGAYLYKATPSPIPSAVIAMKPGKEIGEHQLAIKLPDGITAKQVQLLDIAYRIAKKDGHKDPELVQSVLLQETRAGGMDKYKVANEKGEPYYGPMQIKLNATKDILALHPELYKEYGFQTRTDDEIKANLILNDEFNIRVGSLYLLLLHKAYGYSGRQLMNAYNTGAAGVQSVDNATFHYAIGGEQKLAAFKKAINKRS